VSVERNIGTVHQGVSERIIYSFDITPYGVSPTSTDVVITDNGVDVTDDVSDGSTSVSGDVITLPIIHSLEAGHAYRVSISFVAQGNTWEPYFTLIGEE
jgi:hypothetical protein